MEKVFAGEGLGGGSERHGGLCVCWVWGVEVEGLENIGIWDIKEILFVCLHELLREDALFLTVEGVVITLSVRHRSKGVSVRV